MVNGWVQPSGVSKEVTQRSFPGVAGVSALISAPAVFAGRHWVTHHAWIVWNDGSDLSGSGRTKAYESYEISQSYKTFTSLSLFSFSSLLTQQQQSPFKLWAAPGTTNCNLLAFCLAVRPKPYMNYSWIQHNLCLRNYSPWKWIRRINT